MLEIEGFQLGTVFQGATFAAIITAILTALGIWIKYAPERGRVANERKTIDMAEMDKILADYAEQVKAFRIEVHTLRNELHGAVAELLASDKISDQRSNWINDMMFIIELLIAELERIDPKSLIIKQARAMLKRISDQGKDPKKSEALNIAETAVRDAHQTVRSTEHAVTEINVQEAKDAKVGNGK